MHLHAANAQEVLRTPRHELVGHLCRRQQLLLLVRLRLECSAIDGGCIGCQLKMHRLRPTGCLLDPLFVRASSSNSISLTFTVQKRSLEGAAPSHVAMALLLGACAPCTGTWIPPTTCISW